MQPLRLVGFAALALLAAGCFRIERRTEQRLPASWYGAWQGTWTSGGSAGGGSMLVAVRAFEGHPVVRVDTDHPCLLPADYRFVLQGLRWELRVGGEPVFVGEIDPQTRTLQGTYGCPQDRGSWRVQWQRELPPIADLGGAWRGSYESLAPPTAGEVLLELDQQWDDGRLSLSGHLELPGLGLELPVAEGQVTFVGEAFTLRLRTDPTAGPVVELGGFGSGATPRVEDGVLQVEDPRVPFQFGFWSATLVGH